MDEGGIAIFPWVEYRFTFVMPFPELDLTPFLGWQMRFCFRDCGRGRVNAGKEPRIHAPI